jgi:serine/threonine protein kinase
VSAPRNPPPDLPGFTFLKGLGGGGFADVFLFQQRRPSRQVAVKVLRDEHPTDENLRQFETEADLMAELSGHPHIVTIYAADVAPDGRPYIVMEYCPQPHFGLRARGGKMPISEVLRVGVQVASAVEAAHAAGILHRDIKPANILTNAYGGPGLTDFGIAGVARDAEMEGAAGLSYAFSAPEVIEDHQLTGSVAADAYALGATLYCLLAGRSPFWTPGGDNSDGALVTRALNGTAPPTGRSDAPPALEHLLAQTLDRDPAARPRSAEALARALQDVEQSLRLAPTQMPTMQVKPATASDAMDRDDDGTRRSNISVVDPDPVQHPHVAPDQRRLIGVPPDEPAAIVPLASRGTLRGEPDEAATVRREGRRKPAVAPVDASELLPGPPDPGHDAESALTSASQPPSSHAPVAMTERLRRHERPRWPVLVGAGATALLVVLGVLLSTRDPEPRPSQPGSGPDTSETAATLPPSAPTSPVAVSAMVDPDGTLTATIDPPEGGLIEDLEYFVTRNDGEPWPDERRIVVDASDGATTEVTITGLDPAVPMCVDVFAKNGSLLSALPTTACSTPSTETTPQTAAGSGG